jgi:hypothetical protein
MTTVRGRYLCGTIDVFEVGSTLTKIRSFIFPPLECSETKIRSFSPTTHRISISDRHTLRILDIQNSECLLVRTGHFLSHCFSSGGSLFAASQERGVHLWKYASGRYTLWKGFQWPGLSNSPLRLSPTPSSIVGHSGDILQVWRLHELPNTVETHHQQYVALSRSGACAATAHKRGNTVTIVDLLAQTPPKFIDTNMMIEGLAITGKVLLVAGSGKLVAWLLTEGRLADDDIGGRRVVRGGSIWTIPLLLMHGDSWGFLVKGNIGVIKPGGGHPHVYHTETGKVLRLTQATQNTSRHLYHPGVALCGRDYLYIHSLSQSDTHPEDSWQISRATLREGWVKDPEGKHRLWVPAEWRTEWDPADWCHDFTTQFSILGGRPVLIKF